METLVLGVELDLPQAEIDRFVSRSEELAAGLEQGLGPMSEGLDDVADGADSAAGSLRGLSGIARVFSTDLAKGITAVTALTKGFAGFRLALGPAAIAVTAVMVAVKAITAVMAHYEEEQDRANQAIKDAEDRADALADALGRSADSARDLNTELRLISGEVDEFGLAAETQAASIKAASEETVKAYDAQIDASRERLDSLRAELDGSKEHQSAIRAERRSLVDLETARDREVESTERTIDTVEMLAEFRRESRDAADQESEAEKALAEQRRRAAEAARLAAEEERKRQEQLESFARLHREVADIEGRAIEASLSGTDRILHQRDEQIARLKEIQQLTLGTADTASAEAAVRAEAEQQLMALRSESIATLSGQQEAAHQQELARIEAERATRVDSIATIGGALGSLSDLAIQAAQKQAATDQKAAQAALKTAKRLSIAEASVNLAGGIMAAAGRLAGRPIATGIAVAGLLATYATQVAAISSQSLHQGGYGRGAPDEYRAADGTNRLREERVISPAGSRQEEQIRQIERGRAGPQVVVIEAYKHHGRYERDLLAGQGPLVTAIRQSGQPAGPGSY